MTLAQTLDLRQNQRLALTPQMQMAIRILAMNRLELAETLNRNAEENPLLECESPSDDQLPLPQGELASENSEEFDYFQSRENSQRARPIPATPDGQYTPEIAATLTLRDHLLRQIAAMRAPDPDRRTACLLVDELDERGYLAAPAFEIAARHALAVSGIERGLALLQSCEPTGVGARNLAECLSLQLVERGQMSPDMQAVLDFLDLLEAGNVDRICSATGLSAHRVATLLAQIRDTSADPAATFARAETVYAIPEVLVSRAPSGDWLVEMNTEKLPRAWVNEALVRRAAGQDSETRRYVQECRRQADFLLRAVDQRAHTILRVATEIVRRQHRFLEQGILHLQPMTLTDVAESLGIHESTVSRVVNGKYAQTPRGNLELRSLFSTGIETAAGRAVSVKSVQHRIKSLVAGEDPEMPFSDNTIAKILQEDGVVIARRTIAKYREAMGIPSSSLRRRCKAG